MMIKKLISSIFKVFVLASLGLAQANAQTTTAGILPLAKTQFLDQNGNPLSSGKVYFYSPGTTTAKTTWSDINKTTPNLNPVSLDAGGRAIVWGDGSYRQQVYDRSNNLIWDQTTAVTGASSGGGIGDGLAVGTILAWAGLTAPINYQFAYGQTLSRSIYPDLLAALTITQSVTCVGGNPTITSVADTTSLSVGTVLEANCVTGSPTILSKTSSTVTLSGNASVSVTTTGTFYPYGNGDGSTTFNVPDYRGVTLVGRCNMGGVDCSNLNSTYFSTNSSNTPSALNAIGGNQSKTLAAANIPSITSTNASQSISVFLAGSGTAATATPGNSVTSVQVNNTGAGAVWVPTISTNGWGGQNNSTGNNAISVVSTGTTDTAFSIIPPEKTSNYIIKVTSDASLGTATISQLRGGLPNKLTGTDNNGIFGNVNLPTGLTLASSNLNFLAQACAGSTWLKSIDTNGTFTCTQPAFSDISGTIASAQLPLATNAVIGGMKGDGATVSCTAGVCTAIGAVATSIDAGGLSSITNGNANCTLYDNAGKVGCLYGSFPRLAKTATYTTATADCNTTVALGGSAYYAVTFNAPSGYQSTCGFNVLNEDTGRAKLILPQFATSSTSVTVGTGSKAFTTASGLNIVAGQRYRVYSLANTANWMAGTATYATTTLTVTVDATNGSGTFTDWQVAPEIYIWPLQSRQVYNQNNVWQLSPFTRWVLPGRGNVYELCYAQNGSDSNDGLGAGSGCLAKVQSAVNIIGTQWDGGGYNACSIGIYTGGTNQINESISQTGQSIGCYLTANFRGAVTWSTAGACWSTGDLAIIIINMNLGFVPTLHCNNTNLALTCQFYGHQEVIWDINGAFEWDPQGSNDCLIVSDAQGRATLGLSTIVVGTGAVSSANNLMNCLYGCRGMQISGTVAFSANVTLAQTYILHSTGLINAAASYTGAPTVSAASIPTGNSVLITNGTTIPGGTSTLTGGQVCTSAC